uniref:Dynein heavy chain hydrolytic ATP-binding dynein motor region domain-containing protein n=1 Tax=Panagrolaimus davidi TaxID=227884 RepID=A0A914PS46_9BILA
MKEEAVSKGENVAETDMGDQISEQQILIQSIYEALVPKLVSEDITLFKSLLHDFFPDVEYQPKRMDNLREAIGKVCDQLMLSYGGNKEERGQLCD